MVAQNLLEVVEYACADDAASTERFAKSSSPGLLPQPGIFEQWRSTNPRLHDFRSHSRVLWGQGRGTGSTKPALAHIRTPRDRCRSEHAVDQGFGDDSGRCVIYKRWHDEDLAPGIACGVSDRRVNDQIGSLRKSMPLRKAIIRNRRLERETARRSESGDSAGRT